MRFFQCTSYKKIPNWLGYTRITNKSSNWKKFVAIIPVHYVKGHSKRLLISGYFPINFRGLLINSCSNIFTCFYFFFFNEEPSQKKQLSLKRKKRGLNVFKQSLILMWFSVALFPICVRLTMNKQPLNFDILRVW